MRALDQRRKSLDGQTWKAVLFSILVVTVVFILVSPASAPAQNVIRIAAVVNDRIISALDIVNRINFTIVTANLPNTAETRKRLYEQTLKKLIDEEIQLQEAERQNSLATDREIDREVQLLEKKNRMRPGQLEFGLSQRGVSIEVLRKRLYAEISWIKAISRIGRRDSRVSDEEIDEELAEIQKLQNQPQYRVSEIFLSVDNPDQEQEVMATAKRLVGEIKNGNKFANIARAFSQSSSARLGGDLGWVRQGQLEDILDQVIQQSRKGQVTGPLRGLSGLYIIKLLDVREPAGSSTNEDVVRLQQIILAKGITALNSQLADVRNAVTDCGQFDSAAKAIGVEGSGPLGKVKIGDLPDQFRETVSNIQIGKLSEPIATPSGNTVLLQVCERDRKKITPPSRTTVRRILEQKKLDLLAQRHLRDLRRTAFIDLRG